MIPLTPSQREYKEKTLNQLLANLPILEEKLSEETRREIITSLENQLNAIQPHINLLQTELAEGVAGEPVADNLCFRVARALANNKFRLAKRYINKLETVEPFYPGIERLRSEAEAERASRRTRSIAQGTALPYGAAIFSVEGAEPVERIERSSTIHRRTAQPEPHYVEVNEKEKGFFSQIFQFHIILSCLVLSLIICVMTSMGGVTMLQFLFEGG